MTNKSIVAKRLALALVAALGFGVVQTAPSGAAVTASSTILTLSATSTTAVQGETTTAVTVTVQFTAPTASNADSITVTVASPSGAATNNTVSGNVLRITTDSANATVAYTAGDSASVTIVPTLANGVSRAVLSYTVRQVTTGNHGYTLNATNMATIVDSELFTVNVSSADESASATKSNLFINKVLPSGTTYIRSDSALIVSAGQKNDLTLMTPAVVAYAMGEFRNAAGDSINATTGTAVSGTMVVKITSGPGFLSRYETATATQLVRQISITRGDSIVIWNDGSAGIGTITTYISTIPLTDPADTITFFGKAEKFVATANAVTAADYNLSTGTDSATSAAYIITFVATDAAGIKVPSASQNRNQVFQI